MTIITRNQEYFCSELGCLVSWLDLKHRTKCPRYQQVALNVATSVEPSSYRGQGKGNSTYRVKLQQIEAGNLANFSYSGFLIRLRGP